MLLKVKVNVGNITNLSDARYCAGMGVDMLGFPIGNGPGKIGFESFLEISEWVSGPSFVLEYSDAMDDDLFEKVTQSGIQYIRLNERQLNQLLSKLSPKSIILDTNLSEWETLTTEFKPYLAALVLHDVLSKEIIQQMGKVNKEVQVLLPFENIKMDADQIPDLPIAGIVLSGSEEDKPGQKDYDALASVLEVLEAD